MPIRRLSSCQYLVYSDDGAALIDLSRDTANYGIRRGSDEDLTDDDIARLIPDKLDGADEDQGEHWELTPEEEELVRDIMMKHPAGTWIVQGASPLEKIKEAGKKIGDKGREFGQKIGEKADQLKKGAKEQLEKVPMGPRVIKLFEDLLETRKAGADARDKAKKFLKENAAKLGSLEKAMKKNAGLIKSIETSIQRGYMQPSEVTDLATLLERDPELLENMNLTDLEDPENAPVVMMLDDFSQLFDYAPTDVAMEDAHTLNELFAESVRRKGAQFEAVIVSDVDKESGPQMNMMSRAVSFTFKSFNQMSLFIQKLGLKRESGTIYSKK